MCTSRNLNLLQIQKLGNKNQSSMNNKLLLLRLSALVVSLCSWRNFGLSKINLWLGIIICFPLRLSRILCLQSHTKTKVNSQPSTEWSSMPSLQPLRNRTERVSKQRKHQRLKRKEAKMPKRLLLRKTRKRIRNNKLFRKSQWKNVLSLMTMHNTDTLEKVKCSNV